MSKTAPSPQKLRGGYYTPRLVAQFLTRWAITDPKATVLEPSCGDGAILFQAGKTLLDEGATSESLQSLLQGVELIPQEAEKARNRLKKLSGPYKNGSVKVGDFFDLCVAHLRQTRRPPFQQEELFDEKVETPFGEDAFDAVIGNPPFIRYQNFPEENRKEAFKLMERLGLSPTRLTNAWVPFVVASTLMLRANGRLAMVIPAELLQVSYTAELREFLADYYREITLLTFRSLIFEGVQQEVVLVLGIRDGDEHTGIRTVELDDMNSLKELELGAIRETDIKPMDHSTEKWTQYFLEREEIQLLRDLREDDRLIRSGVLFDVDVGIVTGRNKFFILTHKEVRQWGLEDYVSPVVSRSAHASGLRFTAADWNTNRDAGLPCYVFTPPAKPFDELPEAVQEYVRYGEEKGFDKGYKCRIRRYWWVVPSLWTAEGFLLRQIHAYPKLVLNNTEATTTDTIHRVRFLGETEPENVVAAFQNSLTFAFSEVVGRSYGGGVLELEPTEGERLPVPIEDAKKLDLQKLDQWIRKDEINSVIEYTDNVLLRDGLKLDSREINMLRTIWKKLRDRRINRR